MTARFARCLWLATVMTVSPAWSGTLMSQAMQRDAERAALNKERGEANAQFAAQSKTCQTQFVVTSCMNEAVSAHRQVLKRVHQRELQLNDEQRHEVAEQREGAIAAKAAASDARAAGKMATPIDQTHPEPAMSKPAATIQRPRTSTSNMGAASAAEQRKLTEQRNESAFEERQRKFEAHRSAVLRRNAERAAKGKVVPPLPLPLPASAP